MYLFLMRKLHLWLLRGSNLYCAMVTIVTPLKRYLLNRAIKTINFFLTKKRKLDMPALKVRFSRGTNVYITATTPNLAANGFRVVNNTNEDRMFVCIGGVSHDEMNREAVDVANTHSIENMPPGVHLHRIPLSNLITCEEYHKLKGKKFVEDKEPIDLGSIVVLTNQGERLIYAKVLNVEKTKYGDQYEIMTSGSNMSHVVRRNDIMIPKEAYNVRDTTLKKTILEYSEGSNVQIIGSFLYIGGDDILIHEKFATNKKII